MANSSIDRDPGTLIEVSGLLVDCWGLEVSDLLVDCWGLDLNLRVPANGHGTDDLRVQEVLVTRLGILERIQLEKGVKGTKTKRIPKVTKTTFLKLRRKEANLNIILKSLNNWQANFYNAACARKGQCGMESHSSNICWVILIIKLWRN